MLALGQPMLALMLVVGPFALRKGELIKKQPTQLPVVFVIGFEVQLVATKPNPTFPITR